uniref:Uncharacterized protein n=1 Tax=Ciona savignyi TaxID=51511 RepID=H2YCW3_CIOSA
MCMVFDGVDNSSELLGSFSTSKLGMIVTTGSDGYIQCKPGHQSVFNLKINVFIPGRCSVVQIDIPEGDSTTHVSNINGIPYMQNNYCKWVLHHNNQRHNGITANCTHTFHF